MVISIIGALLAISGIIYLNIVKPKSPPKPKVVGLMPVRVKPTEKQKKGFIILSIGVVLFIGGFYINKPSYKKSGSSVKEEYVTPSSSNSSSSSRTSYEKDVVFNQGYTDYTNCLKKGIKLSIDEERMVFGVKFPKGNDEDFQNYQNGCQRAFGEFSTKNY